MENGAEAKEYSRNIQYATSRFLHDRYSLHQRYTPHGQEIWDLVWDTYEFKPGDRLLEVGCGFGAMWSHHAQKLPKGMDLTLSDFSPGMLENAKSAVQDLPARITFEIADVEALPYETGSFDVVLAHFMLYHTADKKKALSEIRRVLRKGGWAGIILNCADHMPEFEELALIVDPAAKIPPGDPTLFSAEAAEPLLNSTFSTVKKYDYSLCMEVDDVDCVVTYAQSLKSFQTAALREDFWSLYEKHISEIIERDKVLPIVKHCLVSVCS